MLQLPVYRRPSKLRSDSLRRLQNYIFPTRTQFLNFLPLTQLKLSVSHFFNCPQAAELNLILFQSKERPNGAVPKPGMSIEQAAKKINLDLNHIGLGGDVNQGVR